MKLTFQTLTIVLATMIGLVRPGIGQQPYPVGSTAGSHYPMALQAQAYAGPQYSVAQSNGGQPWVGTTSIVNQAMPQGVQSAQVYAPATQYVPSYSGVTDPELGACSGCDDQGCASCWSGFCDSGLANDGLFKGGLFKGGLFKGGLLEHGLFKGDGLGARGHYSGLDAGRLARRVWGSTEYLLLWHKHRTLPPLVTTSPQGTPDTLAGVLGQPTTTILFGNQEISDDAVSGYRSTIGFWGDDARSIGLGVRYFDLENQEVAFNSQSQGNPILARPFFNIDPIVNAQDALLVAYPGVSRGGINGTSDTDVNGVEVFARYKLFCGYGNRIDLIGGYQHTEVDEVIRIRHHIVSVDGTTHGPVGTQIRSEDRWEATNEFNGGEIGFMSEANDGCLTWSLLSKIAFGNMRQGYNISGFTSTTVPGGGSAGAAHGLLNLPSNIGIYERDEFAFIPELNVNVALSVTSSIQLSVGYNLIYWSDIVLANQAIDTTINPTQVTGGLVGQAAPVFTFPESQSFWTQGLSFGGSVRF